MTRGRRVAIAVGILAGALIAGRVAAVLYGQYTWFNSLGAAPVWFERLRDTTLLRLGLGTFAALFAFINLAAIRRSIVSLALPRKIGNVEIGEAVPSRYLYRVVAALSVTVGLLLAFGAPNWTLLSLARTGLSFGEADPYYNIDLGFYVGWLPLEKAVYLWTIALVSTVTALVVGLYSLTPGLRWYRGRLQVSVYARRHITVLGTLALLLLAWSYRLDAYALLVRGSGPSGAFSYVDHRWLAPTYLFLAIGTAAAAGLILLAGWSGQLRTSFLAVTAVLVVSVSGLKILPFLLRQIAPAALQRLRNVPYLQTRDAFTRRAYGIEGRIVPPDEIAQHRSSTDSAVTNTIASRYAGSLVYPGALGAMIVGDSLNVIAAPGLPSGIRRLAHAWSQQDMSLVSGNLPRNAKLIGTRDVRARVSALAPIFAQGSYSAPLFRGDTLYWSVELYSASSFYPLSAHYLIAGSERSYFRHAATAVVHSTTGRTTLFPTEMPDPVARAWIARYPGLFAMGAQNWARELSNAPPSVNGEPVEPQMPSTDSTFRARATALYNRMRAALSSGDLATFGATF
ncbi:MAG: UPF0182 family protein, partial [Gemmatimonadaceae bacterium]|nr:UPF0182 family protein [Gemmatimonadaceae bacterium]